MSSYSPRGAIPVECRNPWTDAAGRRDVGRGLAPLAPDAAELTQAIDAWESTVVPYFERLAAAAETADGGTQYAVVIHGNPLSSDRLRAYLESFPAMSAPTGGCIVIAFGPDAGR